jgi:hypothetical protein
MVPPKEIVSELDLLNALTARRSMVQIGRFAQILMRDDASRAPLK